MVLIETERKAEMIDEDFRTFALGLPETSEGEHDGLPTFKVRGRRFATLGWPAPHRIAFALDPEELDLLLAAGLPPVERAPGAWGLRGHAHLDLAAAEDSTIRTVVIMAWRRCAPPRLSKSFQP
jgi:hypothetical protein